MAEKKDSQAIRITELRALLKKQRQERAESTERMKAQAQKMAEGTPADSAAYRILSSRDDNGDDDIGDVLDLETSHAHRKNGLAALKRTAFEVRHRATMSLESVEVEVTVGGEGTEEGGEENAPSPPSDWEE